MTGRTFAIDAVIVAVVVAAVLIVSPGSAVTTLIALVILLGVAVSFAGEAFSRRGRRRRG